MFGLFGQLKNLDAVFGAPVPDHMAVRPVDPWPGCEQAGRLLCQGVFTMGEERLELYGECWEPVGASAAWLAHLHGFTWLRDLRAAGGEAARQQARAMIGSWANQYSRPYDLAWRPDIMGERLCLWISLHEFFSVSASDVFSDLFFDSLTRQARYLAKRLESGPQGPGRLRAIKGLIYAGLAFEEYEAWIEAPLEILKRELERQILRDGSHISRAPAQLAEALQVLVELRMALAAGGYPVPESMEDVISKMASALKFFRCGDKRFALVNGSQKGDPERIDAILAQAGARGKRLSSLPSAGFERVSQGRSLIIFDCGRSPDAPYDAQAHAAPLSFEMSYGKDRVFVNCGSHPACDQWRDVLRATAAHNTLTIDHRNACEIKESGHFARRVQMVDPLREEVDGNCLLECSHDGYVALNGITHRRKLFLSNEGHDLRGEDTLTCVTKIGAPHEIAIRFHVHPRVLVSLTQDRRAALLRLPSGIGWRFVHSGGELALEDSIYLGEGGQPRKTMQIVLHGEMVRDNAQIKWALQREGL